MGHIRLWKLMGLLFGIITISRVIAEDPKQWITLFDVSVSIFCYGIASILEAIYSVNKTTRE